VVLVLSGVWFYQDRPSSDHQVRVVEAAQADGDIVLWK
jgi:hypothetical protein